MNTGALTDQDTAELTTLQMFELRERDGYLLLVTSDLFEARRQSNPGDVIVSREWVTATPNVTRWAR